MNTYFPLDTLTLMRAYIAAKSLNCDEQYCDLIFDSAWSKGVNLGAQNVVVDTLNSAGLKGAEIMALTKQASVKGVLKDSTDHSISRGIFGAPTMFIDSDMYFGQDRLDFVEEALQKNYVEEV